MFVILILLIKNKEISNVDFEHEIKCNYSEFHSWKEDITKISKYSDL